MKAALRSPITLLMRIVVLLLALTSSAAASAPAKTVIEQAKKAVVSITTFDANQNPISRGSGFFIEQDRLVTNVHVIKDASYANIRTFDGRGFPIQGIVALDLQNDLALLQTNVPVSGIATLSIAAAFRPEGEQVAVISITAKQSFTISTGLTDSLWYIEGAGEYIRITASTHPGNSGSPVVNAEGQVIGVATLHVGAADNLTFAVPAERIEALIPGPLLPLPRLKTKLVAAQTSTVAG